MPVRDFPEELAIGEAIHFRGIREIRWHHRELAGTVAVAVTIFPMTALALFLVQEHALVDGGWVGRKGILKPPR